MVQIEAPSTPECQEVVSSQGGQHREENSARKAMMLKLVAPSLVACYLNRLQPLENIFADS